MIQLDRGRQCAICGKRTGSISGFRHILSKLGYSGGYAHHRCIDKARGAKQLSER